MKQGSFYWTPSFYYPTQPYFVPTQFFFDGQTQNCFNFPHTHYYSRNSIENDRFKTPKTQKKEERSPPLVQKESKRQFFVQKKQKQDRNSYSNSLKLFMKYLRDLKKRDHRILRTVIDKVSKKEEGCYSMEQFFRELSKVLPSTKSYIGMTEIQIISTGGDVSSQFAKAFRILFRHFYKEELYNSVITSKKITGKAKEKQIEEARIVYKKLIDQR